MKLLELQHELGFFMRVLGFDNGGRMNEEEEGV